MTYKHVAIDLIEVRKEAEQAKTKANYDELRDNFEGVLNGTLEDFGKEGYYIVGMSETLLVMELEELDSEED